MTGNRLFLRKKKTFYTSHLGAFSLVEILAPRRNFILVENRHKPTNERGSVRQTVRL